MVHELAIDKKTVEHRSNSAKPPVTLLMWSVVAGSCNNLCCRQEIIYVVYRRTRRGQFRCYYIAPQEKACWCAPMHSSGALAIFNLPSQLASLFNTWKGRVSVVQRNKNRNRNCVLFTDDLTSSVGEKSVAKKEATHSGWNQSRVWTNECVSCYNPGDLNRFKSPHNYLIHVLIYCLFSPFPPPTFFFKDASAQIFITGWKFF